MPIDVRQRNLGFSQRVMPYSSFLPSRLEGREMKNTFLQLHFYLQVNEVLYLKERNFSHLWVISICAYEIHRITYWIVKNVCILE